MQDPSVGYLAMLDTLNICGVYTAADVTLRPEADVVSLTGMPAEHVNALYNLALDKLQGWQDIGMFGNTVNRSEPTVITDEDYEDDEPVVPEAGPSSLIAPHRDYY